jgi:cytochrome c oxidase subunit 4
LADYVRVAGALAVVTSLEVAIYYLEPLRGVLVELFLALSSIKFMLVVMWYMHLRFDSPIFSFLFAFGVAVAIAVFIATLATMGAGLL